MSYIVSDQFGPGSDGAPRVSCRQAPKAIGATRDKTNSKGDAHHAERSLFRSKARRRHRSGRAVGSNGGLRAAGSTRRRRRPGSRACRPSMADFKLAPHASPMTVTPLEKIQLGKLKVPAGFKVEVWAHGMPGARMMARGDKGTLFIGTRVIGKVYAVTDKDGKREHKVIAEGLQQPNGIAFKNGTLYVISHRQGAALRRHRGQARRAAADRHQRGDQAAAVHAPQLEVCGRRTRQQALHLDRLALQHLRDQPRQVRPDPPAEPRRLQHRDRGARRAQLGGLRLAPADQGAVVHRQRPRLGRRCGTGGGAEPRRRQQRRRLLRLPLLPRQRHPRSRHQEAQPVRRRHACLPPRSGPMPPRSACASTPATCSRADYKNNAFIARRGSWNRTKKFGYDVVLAKINGAKATITPFMTGFLDPPDRRVLGPAGRRDADAGRRRCWSPTSRTARSIASPIRARLPAK